RDLLSRPVAIAGVPFVFVDTAGLHDQTGDTIETIGIARARDALGRADLVLWLGAEGEGPAGAWEIEAQLDRPEHVSKQAPRHRLSAHTGAGLDDLRADLLTLAHDAMPQPGQAALNGRQHRLLSKAEGALSAARAAEDPLLIAEDLRVARAAFDALLGRTATEDMLDALFGRFCIGK
ncbi:MAG: tRNA uridine-5-carboxymethylaminomethyl(34) synthesis GTPase MnmE, partial [Novosphingobium sp.]|nr:tRNA uridine-5-carboxymethylaminomethyl(34) synthesis GTPase MnmE [Novosphingobium sp.]